MTHRSRYRGRGPVRICAATQPRDRGAFTLIEVLVALAVSGLVLLAARGLLDALADGADRVTAHASVADRNANGERLVRGLLARAEAGTLPARPFAGDARAVRFSSWCDVPSGWLERCHAALVIDRDVVARGASENDALLVAVVLSTGEIVPLRHGVGVAELLYLSDARDGGHWLRGWGASVTAPLAVGVVMDGDTLVLRIGERG